MTNNKRSIKVSVTTARFDNGRKGRDLCDVTPGAAVSAGAGSVLMRKSKIERMIVKKRAER